ncbi:acyl-CoA dehydrogenase [Nocardioides sp. YIM 152588]|uniref:acyl-CoA dehydrogenase n=1 Tax=Nocardioides sp. YIM 152588 TaxID=3158259 RepID=UPI0032E52573
MRFELTEDQRDFATALDGLIAGSDPVGAARAWAADDTAPGLALWKRVADQGVNALVVPEEAGGVGASAVELVVAFEVLGRHAVPGPWVESAAYLATALDGEDREAVAAGAVATVAAPPHAPYALDADVAERVYLAGAGGLAEATPSDRATSVDGTRRLFRVEPGTTRVPGDRAEEAFDLAALATAAHLLGAGERVLADSVTYVKQRRQFGREIGSYQAIKHHLADVRIALDFARPLVAGAALAADGPAADRARAVSAAKVACSDAAYLASRTGLQVHGAIGYTQEFDLSLWITRIRALVGAWGTPAYHRARVLDSLLAAGGEG